MAHKHHVQFEALKEVKESVQVSFVKEDGTRVSFPAHKKVLEEVEINFMAKDK